MARDSGWIVSNQESIQANARNLASRFPQTGLSETTTEVAENLTFEELATLPMPSCDVLT